MTKQFSPPDGASDSDSEFSSGSKKEDIYARVNRRPTPHKKRTKPRYSDGSLPPPPLPPYTDDRHALMQQDMLEKGEHAYLTHTHLSLSLSLSLSHTHTHTHTRTHTHTLCGQPTSFVVISFDFDMSPAMTFVSRNWQSSVAFGHSDSVMISLIPLCQLRCSHQFTTIQPLL